MKRRSFFKNTALTAAGLTVLPNAFAGISASELKVKKAAKNIIFLVSDGMSGGTLQMTDLLSRQKLGYTSNWIKSYQDKRAKRTLVDTASANSFVTDSAAASSAWGGGVRVNNGRLNMGENGEKYKPILQKFKNAGKSVGCVTTVPITHATPAGFCVNNIHRGNQEEIALDYLSLKFDVMLGGGNEFFDPAQRKDKQNLYHSFEKKGFLVAKNKSELKQTNKPVLGVFSNSALPYSIDAVGEDIPSLAEMTSYAIEKLSKNNKGFMLQVEAGKVDWAAHANDTPALIYDQIAFDEAVKVALDFAEKNEDTLVVITTDHGNANPGLILGKHTNENFERLFNFQKSNEFIMNKLDNKVSAKQVQEIISAHQNLNIDMNDARIIADEMGKVSSDDLGNSYKLPYQKFAEIQKKYTSVGYAGMNHSSDFVELGAVGANSELFPDFIENHQLHHLLLALAEITD